MEPPLVVVMGVSGSGKSVVGIGLAGALGLRFLDGDDLHPPANVDKMARGIPLDDDDRMPWLTLVGQALAAADEVGGGLVLACSALRRSYRDALRAAAPRTVFVHLDGSRELLESRLRMRAGHFMPVGLLESQLETLELLGADEPGASVSIEPGVDEVVAAAASAVRALQG